jgi:hypothetical protein
MGTSHKGSIKVITTLTSEQISSYQEKGYLSLASAFTPDEVKAWDAESKRLLRLGLAHKHNLRTVMYRTPAGIPIVDRMNPVVDISPLFRALTEDQRITNPLRELYGDEMVLFKDKIIYKMPGVEGYAIHQDYSTWQVFPKDLVSVIVSIDDADADNGAVEFFPGYHDRLLSTPGELRFMNEQEAEQIDVSNVEVVKTNRGDIVIFDCLTPHRSGVNRSSRLRRQLYLSYSSAKNGSLYEEQLKYVEETYRNKRSGKASERLFFR